MFFYCKFCYKFNCQNDSMVCNFISNGPLDLLYRVMQYNSKPMTSPEGPSIWYNNVIHDT